MKALLVAVATVAVLAVGALPGLGLTLAGEESAPSPAVTEQAPHPGPPSWSQGHGRAKQGDKHHDQLKGWAKDKATKDKAAKDKAKSRDTARDKAAGPVGRQHGHAMRSWAHCVGDAAPRLGEGERVNPVAACGKRPTPPGQAR